jgi:FkbM family methyltransferase
MRSLLRRALKLVRLLADPVYRRGLRSGVAAAIEHEAVLAGLAAATVLDIGANRGQFALAARRRFPAALILSFEPLAQARAIFTRAFAGDPRVELFPLALGAGDGTALLHRSRHDDSSSLLPIGDLQAQTFPGTEEVGTENVTLARLDTVLAGRTLAGPVLCKIDVQGGELEALKGFGALAAAIDLVMIELSFVTFYTGQPLYVDIDAHLRGQGFVVERLYAADLDRDGTILQCNALYRRRPGPERR